jgi:peptidoglycan/xylan/chitin deacetylase (PgdA/CDA1 family)
MFVFHRIDDVYATRPDLMRILAAFERHQVPVILGVIPRRLTSEMALYLAARPLFAIYQHGVEHKSYAGPEAKDEFPESRARTEVATLLAEGRARLESSIGRRVTGYIPPWNLTAPATLEILAAQGFTHVSAKRTYGHGVRLASLPIAIDTLSSYAPPRARSCDEILALIGGEQRKAPRAPVGLVYHIKDLSDGRS